MVAGEGAIPAFVVHSDGETPTFCERKMKRNFARAVTGSEGALYASAESQRKGGSRIDSYTRGKQIQGGKLVLNHIHPQKVKAKGVVAFLCNL